MRPTPVAVRAFFETHFIPYRVADADGRDVGRVTGYYEPLLKGSRERTPQFTVPLYAPPDDLLTVDLADLYPELKDKRVRARVDGKKVVPYWTRADIERGAIPVTGKTLVYVEDPVEAFYFEIQGSGRIELADGSVIRLGYADQNGHPYRSIARVLIERGDLPRERASMQGISAWAKAHPSETRALLDENPSYRLLPRSAARDAGFARSAHRRTDRDARRAAARGTHDRRRCARHSAGRAGLPRHDDAAVEDAAARVS